MSHIQSTPVSGFGQRSNATIRERDLQMECTKLILHNFEWEKMQWRLTSFWLLNPIATRWNSIWKKVWTFVFDSSSYEFWILQPCPSCFHSCSNATLHGLNVRALPFCQFDILKSAYLHVCWEPRYTHLKNVKMINMKLQPTITVISLLQSLDTRANS